MATCSSSLEVDPSSLFFCNLADLLIILFSSFVFLLISPSFFLSCCCRCGDGAVAAHRKGEKVTVVSCFMRFYPSFLFPFCVCLNSSSVFAARLPLPLVSFFCPHSAVSLSASLSLSLISCRSQRMVALFFKLFSALCTYSRSCISSRHQSQM